MPYLGDEFSWGSSLHAAAAGLHGVRAQPSTDPPRRTPAGERHPRHDEFARAVLSGTGGRTPALRACVTSYETQPEDMDELVRAIASCVRAARWAFAKRVEG